MRAKNIILRKCKKNKNYKKKYHFSLIFFLDHMGGLLMSNTFCQIRNTKQMRMEKML